MELLTMSKEELRRLEVMKHLEEKRMARRRAAEILGVSVRYVKRLLRAYRCQGGPGWYRSSGGSRATINWTGERWGRPLIYSRGDMLTLDQR
jgi:transposase